MAFNGNKITEYKDGRDSQTGTLARGSTFDNEFNRLYDNDDYLKSEIDKLDGASIDTDATLASNSDNRIPSVKAAKKYADSNFVGLSGDQEIAGTKTFKTSPKVPSKNTAAGNNPTVVATEAQVYLKSDDADVVKLTGDQTIKGTKTFGTSPGIPSKSTAATNNAKEIATEAQVYDVAVAIANFKAWAPNAIMKTDIYVNGSTGTDSISDPSQGLTAASPFKTIGYAINRAYERVSGRKAINIHIASGTYTESLSLTDIPNIRLLGPATTYGSTYPSVIIQNPTSSTTATASTTISITRCDNIRLEYIHFKNLDTPTASPALADARAMYISQSSVSIINCVTEVNSASIAYDMYVTSGSEFSLSGYETRGEQKKYVFRLRSGAQLHGGTYTVKGNQTWSTAFILAEYGGRCHLLNTPTQSGTLSGKKYQCTRGGIITITSALPSGSSITDGAADATSFAAAEIQFVQTVNDQTIAGLKKFTTSPAVPSKTAPGASSTAVATEAQLDARSSVFVAPPLSIPAWGTFTVGTLKNFQMTGLEANKKYLYFLTFEMYWHSPTVTTGYIKLAVRDVSGTDVAFNQHMAKTLQTGLDAHDQLVFPCYGAADSNGVINHSFGILSASGIGSGNTFEGAASVFNVIRIAP